MYGLPANCPPVFYLGAVRKIGLCKKWYLGKIRSFFNFEISPDRTYHPPLFQPESRRFAQAGPAAVKGGRPPAVLCLAVPHADQRQCAPGIM